MEYKFLDLDYMRSGSFLQKYIADLMDKLNIYKILEAYNPVLVGTFPIGINIDGSDLDIACEVYDFEAFIALCDQAFGNYKNYKLSSSFLGGQQVLVVNFFVEDFEFELYAESKNVIMQNGYRHMVVEERIMVILGHEFKKEVIRLKEMGLKTEPAFGKILGLESPYDDLITLYKLPEDVLKIKLLSESDDE